MRIPVVILGNKPLTLEVARFIITDSRFNLVGIVIGEKSSSSQVVTTLEQFAKINNIPRYHDSEALEYEDFRKPVGVSIGYPKILKKPQIEVFDMLVNLHFGELPWYRGSGTASHAILNGDVTFGMTLHRINEGVDTGPIYRIERFPIEQNARASDIIRQGEALGLQMVRESLAPICYGEIAELSQDSLLHGQNRTPKQYFRKSLQALKVVDGFQTPEAVMRQYRAGCLSTQVIPTIQFGSRNLVVSSLTELELLISNHHFFATSASDSDINCIGKWEQTKESTCVADTPIKRSWQLIF